MVKAGTIRLIGDSFPRGVFDEPGGSWRDVYCTIRSVSQTEAYEAMGHGLSPEYRFVLAHDFEYQGEKMCEYDGQLYRIIRTYAPDGSDGIELTVERMEGNAYVG